MRLDSLSLSALAKGWAESKNNRFGEISGNMDAEEPRFHAPTELFPGHRCFDSSVSGSSLQVCPECLTKLWQVDLWR